MTTGTVKWFDCKKGFGFVVNSDGKDVFIHFSVIEGEGFRSLKEGEVIKYEQATGANGLFATKVVREITKTRSVAAAVQPSLHASVSVA